MGQLLKFEDEITLPEESKHDVLREGVICFLVGNKIIPVRFCSPPPRPFNTKDAYCYIAYS